MAWFRLILPIHSIIESIVILLSDITLSHSNSSAIVISRIYSSSKHRLHLIHLLQLLHLRITSQVYAN
jgi:hypothetical protein